MKLLLDTNALLWWLQDSPQLGSRARGLIARRDNEILVSIASPWEISIKYRTGKLAEKGSAFMQTLAAQGLMPLPVTAEHLAALEALPPIHRDPFDHLILAQAQVEGASIITSDEIMPRYGVRCIGVN